MTRTFLLDLNVGSDTDFLAIAEELKTLVETHSDFEVLSSKPWSGKTTGALPTLIPPATQSIPPTGQQP